MHRGRSYPTLARALAGLVLPAIISACSTTGILHKRNDTGVAFPAPYHMQSLEASGTVATPDQLQAHLQRSFNRYSGIFDTNAVVKLNCKCEVGQRSRSYILWSTAWYEAVLTCVVSRGDTAVIMSSRGEHQIITGIATGVGVAGGVGLSVAGSPEGAIALPVAGLLTDVIIGATQSDREGIRKAVDASVDAMTGRERR